MTIQVGVELHSITTSFASRPGPAGLVEVLVQQGETAIAAYVEPEVVRDLISQLTSAASVGVEIENMKTLASSLNLRQRTAMMRDESFIEALPTADRDDLIDRGLARRVWPEESSDNAWHTWMTSSGAALRAYLVDADAQRGRK